MEEPVVAARADDKPFRDVAAEPLQRRLADAEHEERLAQEPALPRLPHQGVEIAAP
jgi:hypothetical protein